MNLVLEIKTRQGDNFVIRDVAPEEEDFNTEQFMQQISAALKAKDCIFGVTEDGSMLVIPADSVSHLKARIE